MRQDTAISKKDNIQAQEEVIVEDILKIIEKHYKQRGEFIALLNKIQAEYGYLPEKSLRIISEKTGRSLVDIYSVATFYSSFTLKPRGKHIISACLGTACHVRGAPRVIETFEQQLGIKTGQTTPDKQFTLDTVNCLGACALGPVVVIDGQYFSNVKKSKVSQILEQSRQGYEIPPSEKENGMFFGVSCPHCNHSFMDNTYKIDGHPSIKLTISLDRREGWLRVSSLYGSHNNVVEFELPLGTVVDFLCPHCSMELHSSFYCPMCDASMVPMLVDGGGIVEICSRQGCKNHMLDLV